MGPGEIRLTGVVIVLVAAGLVAIGLASLGGGIDVVALVIIVLTVALGALGIAVARKAGRGAVAPARCAECDGLVSPNAPYCKHCGAPQAQSKDD
ncbi:MAG: hypothetical protein ABR529_08650 [Actinomycetota bacterium]